MYHAGSSILVQLDSLRRVEAYSFTDLKLQWGRICHSGLAVAADHLDFLQVWNVKTFTHSITSLNDIDSAVWKVVRKMPVKMT